MSGDIGKSGYQFVIDGDNGLQNIGGEFSLEGKPEYNKEQWKNKAEDDGANVVEDDGGEKNLIRVKGSSDDSCTKQCNDYHNAWTSINAAKDGTPEEKAVDETQGGSSKIANGKVQ